MDAHPGNGIKVTAPGGITLEATGRYVALYAAVLLLGVLTYSQHQEARAQHRDMLALHHRTNCVLAIDAPLRAVALRSGDPCEWLLLRWRDDGR